MSKRNPCLGFTLKILEVIIILPALLLLRFGGKEYTHITIDSFDLQMLIIIMTGCVTMFSIIMIINYIFWSQHQPTHPELCYNFSTAMIMCLLGTVIMTGDYGK